MEPVSKETHFHPEAIRLMRTRHRLTVWAMAIAPDDKEIEEIIKELTEIELEMYKS